MNLTISPTQKENIELENNIGKLLKNIEAIKLIESIDSLKSLESIKSIKINEQEILSEVIKNIELDENDLDQIYKEAKSKTPITFDTNIKKISNNQIKKQRYLNSLDNFTTKPDLKYGDNFKNVEHQINQKLLDMGLKDTKPNIIAYKILSKNQIETTKENIQKVKVLNQELDYIADNLHPVIASSIIKKGLAPTKIQFYELKKYIDEFNKEHGKPKNTIEQALINTTENRDELIKLYKSIKQVQKSDNAAIGLVLKHNVNLTFEDLKNASKYFEDMKKENKFDKIDEPLKFNNNNNIIINKPENKQPKVLNKVLSNEPLAIVNSDTNKKDNAHLQTLNIQSLNPYVVTFASNVTTKDVKPIQQYLRDDNKLATSISDIIQIEEDILTTIMDSNLNELKHGDENILKQTYESINKIKLTKDNIEKIKQAKNYIELQEKLNQSGFLSYPVKINDDIQKLNIHLLSEDLNTKKEINAYMNLSKDKDKNIDVHINIIDNDVSLMFKINDDKFINLLEQQKNKLIEKFKDNNLYVKNIDIKKVNNK